MIVREVSEKMLSLARQFPIITLTGPRQSGKSTLVKNVFADYEYLTLEDPDVRSFARDDPRSFLARYSRRVILDEVQRVPELFSYLQGEVDRENLPGQFVLSGSQNFLFLEKISQTLAGRVAVLHLLPLSFSEIANSKEANLSISDFVFQGGYPRMISHRIHPLDFFPFYVSTYVDRDVRAELGVKKVSEFNNFLTLCATRVGQVLNYSSLASDAGISVATVRDWLSILEASFIVFRIQPYYRNYGKRLVKAPKLYFYDTGLAANLMGFESSEQLVGSSFRGPLFENAVVVEIVKHFYALARAPKLFYWRDTNGDEVDFVLEKAGRPQSVIEVKSSATYKPKAFTVLDKVGSLFEVPEKNRFVVYGGDDSFETRHGNVLGLNSLSQIRA